MEMNMGNKDINNEADNDKNKLIDKMDQEISKNIDKNKLPNNSDDPDDPDDPDDSDDSDDPDAPDALDDTDYPEDPDDPDDPDNSNNSDDSGMAPNPDDFDNIKEESANGESCTCGYNNHCERENNNGEKIKNVRNGTSHVRTAYTNKIIFGNLLIKSMIYGAFVGICLPSNSLMAEQKIILMLIATLVYLN